MISVLKRDGRVVPFDKGKIIEAIGKAFEEVDGVFTEESLAIAKRIATSVASRVEEEMSVEDIQNSVEESLMRCSRKDVAKAYIIYRNDRNRFRDMNSSIIQKVMVRAKSEVDDRSNANVDEKTFSGREKEASADISKTIALDYGGLSTEVANAHKNMLIYQHDNEKSIYGVHNCLNLNFQEVFEHGFRTRNGDVRPPKSYSTGCQQMAVGFQCQSQVQFGGVGTIHADVDLAPLVKASFLKSFIISIAKQSEDFELLNFEEMTDEEVDQWVDDNKDKYLSKMGLKEEDITIENKDELDKYLYNSAYFDLVKEGKQSSEALFHNLNTLESRQGSQVPFTSINFGRDTSPEGRLVSKWLLNASLNGIGKHHLTSIFPISIFQYKSGTNADPGDKNYDLKQLALKSMSRRIYPNWVNCDWSQAHEDVDNPDTWFATMGKCKLQLI